MEGRICEFQLGQVFLNKRCDGSHDHASCSGQNTTATEYYTPLIAKAVHQCFSRDTKLVGVDNSDNANFVMPAAICALKPCPGDVHKHVANPLMAGLLPKADDKDWPKVGDTKEWPAKPRLLKKAQERSGSPEQKLVEEEWIEEKVGDDQKVVSGLAGQWRALRGARFVPKQGDRSI